MTDIKENTHISYINKGSEVCMTLDKLKEHCKKQMGMYGGHVSTNTYLEHSLVLDLINEHENRVKHDADLLDKVAEKIREHSGLHYIDCDGYFGGIEELIFKVDDWLDDIIEEIKAEIEVSE